METTTNNQLSIVDELKNKLGDIKDKIKEGGLSNTVFSELTSNAKLLQDKIDTLLNKVGALTQSDINDAYLVLQKAKRSELEALKNKDMKRINVYAIVGVALLIAVFLYKKNKV
jgi:ABC-type antimicrobial peptide transport system permease subunit